MADKEIVIPVSKLRSDKSTEDLLNEVKKEVGFDVSEIESRGMRLTKDGKIAVRFPKFVQLVATHDFETIMEHYDREEVIITSDLLMDLANTPNEESTESRFSWLFMGLVLGVVFAAIVFLIFV
jgi:hypothetical protein